MTTRRRKNLGASEAEHLKMFHHHIEGTYEWLEGAQKKLARGDCREAFAYVTTAYRVHGKATGGLLGKHEWEHSRVWKDPALMKEATDAGHKAADVRDEVIRRCSLKTARGSSRRVRYLDPLPPRKNWTWKPR